MQIQSGTLTAVLSESTIVLSESTIGAVIVLYFAVAKGRCAAKGRTRKFRQPGTGTKMHSKMIGVLVVSTPPTTNHPLPLCVSVPPCDNRFPTLPSHRL